ncbi:MAG: MgtC/SapB family protein [Oscillospiraceae bacterium]|nr:MgtC/SapB family protein [Oscillospiraceae bacterium]
MLSCFDFIRELDFLAIFSRMFLAVICGGLIGIEREYKRRPAGFRTHILICLGAAITTLTSQFMYLKLGLFTDVARLGAQVVAGIGFIGAGTIIVTNRQRVKGLTTAAGLWTSAIIGLVCGAGYAEGAIFATLMVIFAEIILIKIEYRFARKIDDVNLYIEYLKADSIESILRVIRENKVKTSGLEITRTPGDDGVNHYNAIITVQTSKKVLDRSLLKNLTELENILIVEEL